MSASKVQLKVKTQREKEKKKMTLLIGEVTLRDQEVPLQTPKDIMMQNTIRTRKKRPQVSGRVKKIKID